MDVWFSYTSASRVDNNLILRGCVPFRPVHIIQVGLVPSRFVSKSYVALWLPEVFLFIQYGIVNFLMCFHFTGETCKSRRTPSA